MTVAVAVLLAVAVAAIAWLSGCDCDCGWPGRARHSITTFVAVAAAVSRSPAVVFSLAYIMGVVVATIVSVFVHGCLYKLQGCFACRLLACWRLAPWLAGLLA